MRKIDQMSGLSSAERDELKEAVRDKHICGIDANPKIARICRLNISLHGDGGSKIFRADTLDKSLEIERGLDDEEEEQLRELRQMLVEKGMQFDYVLTNPRSACPTRRKTRTKVGYCGKSASHVEGAGRALPRRSQTSSS